MRNQKSVKKVIKVFDRFSKVLGLKPNISKCKIAGIGGMKVVNVALCGMQCINLKKRSLNVLGIHFSYNKKLEQEENFECHILKIENVLKLWKMRDLSIEGKIRIFKSLAISKILHLGLITSVPPFTIEQLNIIKKLSWKTQNEMLYFTNYLRISWS